MSLRALAIALVVTALALSGVSAAPYSPYFSALNDVLKNPANAYVASGGEAAVVIDLDRLDANIATVRDAYVRDPTAVRVVTKSLPSLELLQYVLHGLGSNRLMVFRTNMLQTLLNELSAKPHAQPYDYLLGVPFNAAAADRLLHTLLRVQNPPLNPALLSQVQWLIDTPQRAAEYAALAQAYGLTLRVALEIDIGLHRGGAPNATAAMELLAYVSARPQQLVWSGFMGYDGHCANDPRIALEGEHWFYDDLYASVVAYTGFIDAARAQFPQYFAPTAAPLTFNGAGSLTIGSYVGGHLNVTSVLNDYSMGSGFVKPNDFDFFALSALQPALWLASPVLKAMASADVIPFVDWAFIEKLDPALFCNGYFLSGAGLNAIALVEPQALHTDPFYDVSGDVAVNLLPTQALYHSNCSVSLGVGDYVFFRPFEGDIVVAFDQIVTVRGAQHATVDRWSTYRGGV